jgi:mono/diheme cytochrome c family protein
MRSLASLTSAQITAIANALAQPTVTSTTAAPTTTTTTTTQPTTTTTASTTTTTLASSGAALYNSFCASCHNGAAAGGGGRQVLGARSCSIYGSINGTSVFPNGVPAMRFLQGVLSTAQIQAIADFLNSGTVTGQQRYITTCAGCHGADARGGRTGESVRGASAGDTREAIGDEREMRFLSCLPRSDLDAIGNYLRGSRDGDDGDDEHEDDEEHDD